MVKKGKATKGQLGELEAEIMNIIWEQGEVSVQEVKDALEPNRKLAYTTVMTVMSRLAEKGVLMRHKQGRAYHYSAASSQKKLASSMMRSLIDGLYAGAAGSAIAHLLESDEELSEEDLAHLEGLIHEKRKQQKE